MRIRAHPRASSSSMTTAVSTPGASPHVLATCVSFTGLHLPHARAHLTAMNTALFSHSPRSAHPSQSPSLFLQATPIGLFALLVKRSCAGVGVTSDLVLEDARMEPGRLEGRLNGGGPLLDTNNLTYFGISKERVRQLEERAKKRMRASLEPFVDMGAQPARAA